MSNWVYMGYSGLTWGLVLCGVALPVLAVAQWKLRTRLRAYWLMVTGALIIYSCGVFALTLLPLPQYAQVVCSSNPVRLVPFHSFATVAQAADRYGVLRTVRSQDFWQIVLNVVLMVPLGFIARAVFKRGVVPSTGCAFAASAFIECSQLTGLWGLYDCAYRIFDVDDLMTNTFGGLIGAICAVVWIAARKRPEAPFIPPWASTQRDEVPSTASVDEVFARLTEGCDDVRDKATRDQELVLSGR